MTREGDCKAFIPLLLADVHRPTYSMDEHFVVRHSQRFLAGALALIAFITWTTRGLALARSFLAARSPSLVAYWEFGGWIFVGVLLVSLFLWVVFGRKRLQIRNGKLNVEADSLGSRFADPSL